MRAVKAPKSRSVHRTQRSETLIRNDPKNCLAALFEAPVPLPRGTAEEALLAWLVTLPEGIDPAHAASELGTVAPFVGKERRMGCEAERLCALLEEIALYPSDRLAPPTRRRRQPHYA